MHACIELLPPSNRQRVRAHPTAPCHLPQKHRQLVKSNDDLRQDAVMQQFFALVNHLLAADAASATRRLRMATYHAVAFSGDSGLVQWVTNTLCLNEYLVGSNGASGAHARYGQPGEMTHTEAQVAMTKAHREPGKRGVRAAYDRVVARYPPVLRHFFSERYSSPMLWCGRRAALPPFRLPLPRATAAHRLCDLSCCRMLAKLT